MISCPWSQCPEQFDDRDDLKDHVSSAHLKYFPYRCHECDVMFPSRGQIDYHWSSDHSDRGQPVISCCLNRQKERCLKEILAPLNLGSSHVESSINSHFLFTSTPASSLSSAPLIGSSQRQSMIVRDHGSHHAITVQLQPKHEVSEFDLPDHQRLIQRLADEGSSDSGAEAFPSSSTQHHSDSPSTSRDKSYSGIQEQSFTPEFDGTIPEHLVDTAWDMTMKRKALVGAGLDARFKYFFSQLAMSVPAVSLREVAGYPTNEALYSGFDKFAAELPEDEASKVEMVINAIQHMKKLCSMRMTRDKRRQTGEPESSTNKSSKRRRSFDDGDSTTQE